MNAAPRRRDERPHLRLVTPTDDPTGDVATPVRGIECSPDVVQAVGAATVMRLRADPRLREYACPFCDRPAEGAASLIVHRYANGLCVVRLAHATCSPSTVLRMLHAPTRLHHRVRATCWLRPHDAATAAVLLVDNQVRAWRRHRAQEVREGYARALEAAGFAQAADLDEVKPATPGLTATLTPTGDGTTRIRITHPAALVFDGNVAIPGAWLRQARQDQAVTVVTETGLAPAVPSRRSTPDGVAESLATGRAWTAVAALRTEENPPERQAG